MEKMFSAIEQLEKINRAYDISADEIEHLKQDMKEAKVCTPIIGKFSSGKSALVNTILGYSSSGRILREDITPETAIPAEIIYTEAEDKVTIYNNDGTTINVSVEEYRNFEADANTVKCARIQLRNSCLEEIPDVMIVDMPGFDSGFEIHNKAIDNYLPKSLAYIVAFPADDMIVRSSVGNILKELCLNDMPVCVVITKCDKKGDDFGQSFEKLKEDLKRFVGDREIKYCETSSFDGETQEVERFLLEIQEHSQEILSKSFKCQVLEIADNTENYLKTLLNGSQLTESELDEQEEKLQKELSGLDSKFSQEQKNFYSEISECVDEIKNDVQCAMESKESELVVMIINKQSINEYLNSVVRNAVTVSIKKRFVPKVEKYLVRVANCINSESIGDVHISFNYDPGKIGKGITAAVVAVAAGILLGIPIIGAIVGIIAKLISNKKRDEAKQQIRMKLQNEVFPQVLTEVGNGIEKEVMKQVDLVNDSIESQIRTQQKTLEKAMLDVRTKIKDERERKLNLEADINADLERIGEIKDGLQ